MKVSVLYRIAAVLLLLFAVGHTVGFLQSDPGWKVGALLDSMRSIHFDVQGFNRSYWDFFVGFGLFVTVFLVFSAILAWQLASIPREALASMRVIAWSFAICFVAVVVLSWRFFFAAPVVLSVVVAVCLIWAAWLGAKHGPPLPSRK